MTRGRALFMKTHTPGTLGFAGRVAYIESIDNRSAFTVSITPGTLTEQVSQRWQGPSHFRSVHTGTGLRVVQTKFITQNNVAVANVEITNTESASTTRTIIVSAGHMRGVADLAALNYIRLDDSTHCEDKIVSRLRVAGCPVKDPGPGRLGSGHFADLDAWARRP